MARSFWQIVNKVISDADVLLMVLDARMPDQTRNTEIEEKVRAAGKPLIYVLTKCDLVPKHAVEKTKKQLRPAVFVSALKHYGTTMLRTQILVEAKRAGKDTKKVVVGILGYPNVGKSSLINALKGARSAPASSISGYTKGVQRVKADNRIMLLDTPGVLPYKEQSDQKHATIGAVDATQVKHPDVTVQRMMKQFPGVIEGHYGIDVQHDAYHTLEQIAVQQHVIKKGNEPDTDRMARRILKAWQSGKIRH